MLYTNDTNNSGFLIVRKASSMESVETYNRRFIVENKEYEGFQREVFYDLIEEYYNNKLPLDIHVLIKRVKSSDIFSLPIIYNFHDAKIILDYCRTINDLNEIIFVQQPSFIGNNVISNNDLEWLGYDILSFNLNSLLFMGLFSKPDYFPQWKDKVNIHGLFDECTEIEKYIEHYLFQASKDIVEDYVLPEQGFEVVRIAKVLID